MDVKQEIHTDGRWIMCGKNCQRPEENNFEGDQVQFLPVAYMEHVKKEISSSGKRKEMQIHFEDIVVYFTKEEWESLEEPWQILYKEVMMENYQNFLSLGTLCLKPELISLIEHGLDPCFAVVNTEIHTGLSRVYETKNEPEDFRTTEWFSNTAQRESVDLHKRPLEAESIAVAKRHKMAPALHMGVIKDEPEEIHIPAHKETNDLHQRLCNEDDIAMSVLEVDLHEEITCVYNSTARILPHQGKSDLLSSTSPCHIHVKQDCDQVSENWALMFNGMDSTSAPVVKDEPEDFSITLNMHSNNFHQVPLQRHVTMSDGQLKKEPGVHSELSDITSCVYKQSALVTTQQSDSSQLIFPPKQQHNDVISEQRVIICNGIDPVCAPAVKDEPVENPISGYISDTGVTHSSYPHQSSCGGTTLLLKGHVKNEPCISMGRKEATYNTQIRVHQSKCVTKSIGRPGHTPNSQHSNLFTRHTATRFESAFQSPTNSSKSLMAGNSRESSMKNLPKSSQQKGCSSQNIKYKCAKQPRMHVSKIMKHPRRKGFSDMLKHMRSLIHTHKKCGCIKCGKCYRSKYHLLLHKKLHMKNPQQCRSVVLGEVFSCDKCKKIYKSRYSLMLHTKVHTADLTRTRGNYRKNTYNKRSAILKHRGLRTKEKTYGCTKCKSTLSSKASLDCHLRTHSVQNYPCAICEKLFHKRSDLNSHMKTHHREKLHPCPECGKCFGRRSQVRLHQQMHSGLKPFTCSECGRSFALKHNLKAHERIHTGEKPFSCSECSKEFGRKSQLDRHFRTHTGEKPYFCSTCGKSFALKCTLVAHLRYHTRENLFKCKVCMKGYSTNSQLVRHAAVHEKPVVYRCSTCGKKGGVDCSLILRKVFPNEAERHVCTLCEQLYFIPFENIMAITAPNSL